MLGSTRGLLADLRAVYDAPRQTGREYVASHGSRMYTVLRTLEALGYVRQVGAPWEAPLRPGLPLAAHAPSELRSSWAITVEGQELLEDLKREADERIRR